MALSKKQIDILTQIAAKTKMDCWFSIQQSKSGDDYVFDLEAHKRMSLRRGIATLLDGISGMCREYLTEAEMEDMLSLLITLCLER